MPHTQELNNMNKRIGDLERAQKEIEQWKSEHSLDYAAFKGSTEGGLNLVAKAVHENTTTMAALIKETRGVVEVYRDVSGAIRLIQKIQKFVIACTKWGIVGTAVVYGTDWLKANLPSLF